MVIFIFTRPKERCRKTALPPELPGACYGVALSGRKIRHDYAMTGEIIVGQSASHRGPEGKVSRGGKGMESMVIILKGNVKDIEEIPEEIAKEIEFIPVEMMSDVIKTALKGKRQ